MHKTLPERQGFMLLWLYMKRSYSQKELSEVAREVLSSIKPLDDKATVIALYGELGAGKTTLVQAIASELGVEELVVSPTFVIAKWYKTNANTFYTLVHIDAYRIDSEEEMKILGFTELLKQPRALVIVEWPEKIPETLSTLHVEMFTLHHDGEVRVIEGPLPYEGK